MPSSERASAKSRTVRVRVEGLVQGVGYRVFVEREAIRLGVRGHVRNRRDGSVEVLAQAEAAIIDLLLTVLRSGPHGSRVDLVVACDDGEMPPPGFAIVSTI